MLFQSQKPGITEKPPAMGGQISKRRRDGHQCPVSQSLQWHLHLTTSATGGHFAPQSLPTSGKAP